MKRIVLISAAVVAWPLLTAGSCATTHAPEPIVRVVEVKVPVAISCVPKDLRDAPGYVDGDAALKAAAGPDDRFQLLAAGRVQRKQRLAEIEPIIRACRTP